MPRIIHMANPTHETILRRGKEDWNQWRLEHPDIRPDLHGLSWPGCHLNLYDLTFADLRDATLYAGEFSHSFFEGANLQDANLNSTYFFHAELKGANLARTDLSAANLVRADLTNSDLSEAKLVETVFGGTCLSNTQGLETCKFLGPCTLDLRTIAQSWPLPLAFLRGCGLPETFIEFLPSFLQDPIQFYSCFISYSTKDHEFAERLYADLQTKGLRCWFAPEDLKIGDRFRQRINESIRLHDKLLLILSEESIASSWVEEEVEAALEREKKENRLVLCPITIDGTVWDSDRAWAASLRRIRHIGDFRNWKNYDAYTKSFGRLLRDLEAKNHNSTSA
jgi:uncharacterized protein YjbI with pentapeptide repeats